MILAASSLSLSCYSRRDSDGYLVVPLHNHDEIAEKFVATAKVPTAAVVRGIPHADVTVRPDLVAAGDIQRNIAIKLAQPKTTLLYVTGSSDIIGQEAVSASRREPRKMVSKSWY